jgi:hypothetical protein
MPESKQDRELIELLNELRVALPGVQVLFAFLLTVPFSQGFPRLSSSDRAVYFASFLCTAIATVLLIAPTAYHRLRWRDHDKEHLLVVSNRLAIAGTVFLAAAMSCVVYVISDLIYPGWSGIITGLAAGSFVWFWYGMVLLRELRERS